MPRNLFVAVLVFGAGLFAQTTPSADYIFPSGVNAPLNTKILVHYVCCGTINADSVAVRAGTQPVAGRVESDSVGHWLVFTPAQSFAANTTYTVTVWLPAHTSYSGTFTTGSTNDTTAPVVVATTPGDGEDFFAGTRPPQLRFSKPMNPISLVTARPGLFYADEGFSGPSGTWMLTDGVTLSLQVTDPLAPGHLVRLNFPGKLPEDLAGNILARPPDIVFTTYPSAPKEGPRLTASIPVEAESGVPTNSAIFLLFDKPPVVPGDGVFSLSSSGDPNVPLKIEKTPLFNSLVVRPQALLRGNQDYTLRVNRLYDQFGGQLSNAALLKFHTGALPELRAFRLISGPRDTLPLVERVQLRFNRPLNPYLLPQLTAQSGELPDEIRAAGGTRLIGDGSILEADIPSPGSYVLREGLYDRVECRPLNYGAEFYVSADIDQQPPSVISVVPPDQSVAPPTAALGVVFDEPVQNFALGEIVLLRGETPVPVDLIGGGSPQLTIKPRQPLDAGASYRVEVRSIRDVAGNAAPDLSWSFQVEAPNSSDPLTIVQVEPATGTTAVSTTAELTITFSGMPNPVSIATPYGVGVSAAGSKIPGRWRFADSLAIFRPDQGFPANTQIEWTINAADLEGRRVQGQLRGFFATGPPDQAPDSLRIVRAAEAYGKFNGSGYPVVILEFSQPLLASSLTPGSLVISAGGRRHETTYSYDAVRGQVTVWSNAVIGTDVTVSAGGSIRSIYGAMLEPFTATVSVRHLALSYGLPVNPPLPVFIRRSVPRNYETIEPGSPLILYFSAAMNRGLVEGALRMTAGRDVVSGRIRWTPDSRALTFFPLAPVSPNTLCAIVLSHVPFGYAGAETIFFRTSPLPPYPIVRTSLLGPFARLATDGNLDVEFPRDQPADAIRSAVARSNSTSGGFPDIPMQVGARSSRVFRLRPSRPFAPGAHYTIEFEAVGFGLMRYFFQAFTSGAPESRRLEIGPSAAMGEIPVNGVIWVQAHTQLNPLTLAPRITAADGSPITFTTTIHDEGFLAILRPEGLLDGNTTYTVVLNGLEDSAGRPFPDRTWTFRTGAGPSFTPTTMTSWSPQGTASPSSVLRVTFNQPVFTACSTCGLSRASFPHDFRYSFETATVTGSIQASEDGRTLSFLPDRSWPVNTQIGVTGDRIQFVDWVGANADLARPGSGFQVTPGFLTGSAPAAAPPKIESVNPYDGATGVPLNAEIQARFTEGILEASLERVRVESGKAAVAARVILGADGRTLTLLPQSLLLPNRQYSVIVEGVQNTDGVAQSGVEQWTFTTSDQVQSGATSTLVIPPSSAEPYLRLLLQRPVNPISVDPANFSLRTGTFRMASSVEVESGGRALRVVPSTPLPDGASVTLAVSTLRDWAGNGLGVNANFRAGDSFSAAGLPIVQSIQPAPGATVHWRSFAAVVFDRPVFLRDGVDGVRVVSGGFPVAVTVQNDTMSGTITVRPLTNWMPGEQYDIEVGSVCGLNGLEADPLRWSFSVATEGIGETTPLKLVSTTPVNGAVGVPVDSLILFEFSRPVLPQLTTYYSGGSGSILYSGQAGYPVRAMYDGTRVELRPRNPLPAGKILTAEARVRDIYDFNSNAGIRFYTAATADTTPPTLVSVSPPPGSRLMAGETTFLLRFSEAVTAVGELCRFTAGGQTYPVRSSSSTEGDGRTLLLTLQLPPAVSGTLTLLNGITDLSGNAIAEVSLEYSTASADESFEPYVKTVRPLAGATSVPLDAAIEVTFSQPMNESSLVTAIRVSNDGYFVPVKLAGDDTGKVWQVRPAQPWTADTQVRIEILTTAIGVSGAWLRERFTATFHTASSVVNGARAGAVAALITTPDFVDIRFAAPRTRPPDEPFGIRLDQTRVPARIDQLGPEWFRLTPDTPLACGLQYTLMAGPGIEFPLRPGAANSSRAHLQRSSPEAIRAIRDDNARIHVEFNDTVHPFAVNRDSVRLFDARGESVPHETRLNSDGRTIVIEPFGRGKDFTVIVNGRKVSQASGENQPPRP